MTNNWTQEHRQRQSEAIRRWKPWQQSTGPKTAKGKEAVSRNAYKGGIRPFLRDLARVLREQESQLREL